MTDKPSDRTPDQQRDAEALRALVEACHNSMLYPPERVIDDLKQRIGQIQQQHPDISQ